MLVKEQTEWSCGRYYQEKGGRIKVLYEMFALVNVGRECYYMRFYEVGDIV